MADAESNIAHSEVFWYNQYREGINYTFTDDFFNDYDTLADIKDTKEEYLDYAVEGFVDNLENDFDISSNFIVTDEMKEEYERIVRNDLEEAFNRYISKQKKKQENKIMNNNKETKKERFDRLMSKRVENIRHNIRLVKNLYDNEQVYDHKRSDTEKIQKTLKNDLEKMFEYMDKRDKELAQKKKKKEERGNV